MGALRRLTVVRVPTEAIAQTADCVPLHSSHLRRSRDVQRRQASPSPARHEASWRDVHTHNQGQVTGLRVLPSATSHCKSEGLGLGGGGVCHVQQSGIRRVVGHSTTALI
jgi:hypothetical protein